MLLAKRRTHDPQAVSATDTLANFSNKTQFQRSCPWHDSQSRILQDYFLPMIIPMKVPRMHTCTILLDVMNALPLSMIGSEHCDVFFGNTNLSTHDPSRSRTCARENIHKDTLALSCFNRPNLSLSHHCYNFTLSQKLSLSLSKIYKDIVLLSCCNCPIFLCLKNRHCQES